jgi:hypothetical protein
MKRKNCAQHQLAENAARKILPIFEECGVRHFGKPCNVVRNANSSELTILLNQMCDEKPIY